MKFGSVVLDSGNSKELSEFYRNLLGWRLEDHGEWIVLLNPEEKGTNLTFQQVDDYQRPTWPDEKGKQRQMLHLDFYVPEDQYEQEIERAINLGAVKNPHQPEEDWIVLLDPAGHPFCLLTM